ncbi:sugar phosphate permease [Novosphingobium kunmingense]|uniref:Sugar phosphate permease n=1 Tax=Novosphingobium kunmingense TaxID=1211806 RepID=A0A2N0H3B1_9SPHN|nr:MFS transporter [Novosphingobium kunmingense]PKB13424.1 sugar phosphate permease [Novosphingobium kunmingense]
MTAAVDRPVEARVHVALFLLVLTGALNFVDRQIVAVLIEPIRAELHFSDAQFGLLTGLAFSLFYALFGLPAAMLADRWSRIRLIAAACAVWSLFTALTGSVRSFGEMAAARFGVGVGEAGGTAPSLFLLADCYPPQRRPLVIGLFTLSGPIGVFAGAAFGGWAVEAIGWRNAFVVLGVLGLVLAPLLLVVVREPARGTFDAGGPVKVEPLGKTFAHFVRDPSLRLLGIASGLSSFLSYGMLNWIPAYLMRVEAMPISALATWFAPAAGITMGIGMVTGGWLVNRFIRRSAAAYALIPGLATAVLIPMFGAALLVEGWALSLTLMLVPMVCCTMFTPASLALAQELGHAGARATVTAILLLMYNIVGLGCGPLFVGVVSDALAPVHGNDSLRYALGALLVPALLAVVAHLVLARRLPTVFARRAAAVG